MQRTVPDNLDKPEDNRTHRRIVSRRLMPINRNSLDRARHASTAAVKLETLDAYTVLCTQSNVRRSFATPSLPWKLEKKRKKSPFCVTSANPVFRLRSPSSELHSISFVFSSFFLLALFICRIRQREGRGEGKKKKRRNARRSTSLLTTSLNCA